MMYDAGYQDGYNAGYRDCYHKIKALLVEAAVSPQSATRRRPDGVHQEHQEQPVKERQQLSKWPPKAAGKRYDKRSWLIDARNRHQLTRDEAESIVEKRKGRQNATPEKIEQRVAQRGLSQPDLSVLVGCTQNEICKIEKGERMRPKRQYLEAIGKVFGMSRDEVAYGPQRSPGVS